MELKFKVSARIARPVQDVFEAVADPASLSAYFTTGGAKGRLKTGTTVTWDFADFPGAFPVEVVQVEDNRKIVLRWDANDSGGGAGYKTVVTMTFEPLEAERTLVTISEEGWRETPEGLKGSYDNCGGWMQMLCAMKAWIEHGINLREGMFK
ncbi:SRPBCC family protein [Pararhizobium haloflavum]|uniref:SRPBCC family protein n=1 Tax=Pararhizobium haloflavum TaxID=2037914 RepID=UPI000C1A4A62|nr:SRPBCC family protein [Pararhizobium haloflavum]